MKRCSYPFNQKDFKQMSKEGSNIFQQAMIDERSRLELIESRNKKIDEILKESLVDRLSKMFNRTTSQNET